MKPWGPSWLKLQTEFYPTGFLQARVRQSSGPGGGESEQERGGGSGVCAQGQEAALAPPTPDSPREASRTQTALEPQPCRNYLKLEAQVAEIKSERDFPSSLPLRPEGKCLLGSCVCPWVAV